jgi:hypothetical protein
MPDYLFNSSDLREYIDQRGRDALNLVNGFDAEEILNKPEDDLASIVINNCTVDIPILRRDREVLSQPREISLAVTDYGRSINLPAFQLTLTIPFEGSGRLFLYQPSTFYSVPPEGRISGQDVVITLTIRELVGPQIKATFEKNIKEIEEYLRWQREMADPHNANIRTHALKWVQDRKKKLLAARNMAASIGFNMNPVLPYPTTHKAPQIQRKPPAPARSATRSQVFVSEPELIEDDYQHILQIIESMAHVMERSPHSFSHLGEEDLRQHFLVPLNGHYRGEGKGEAFNNEGKTDILIRVEDRNIFIAECKFWGGMKVAHEAIDQLLGYLTWRDTKACLMMFSKLKDFSYMLAELWKSVESHPNFKREERQEGETRRRYKFRSKNDSDRELILTVLAFNIPKT